MQMSQNKCFHCGKDYHITGSHSCEVVKEKCKNFLIDKMAISRRQGNNTNSSNKVKLCTINICGLSERSKFVINNYVDSKEIDILCLQETGKDDSFKLEIHNMSNISDTNKAANKGVALYVRNKHSIP